MLFSNLPQHNTTAGFSTKGLQYLPVLCYHCHSCEDCLQQLSLQYKTRALYRARAQTAAEALYVMHAAVELQQRSAASIHPDEPQHRTRYDMVA